MKRVMGVLLVALCMAGLSCRTKDVREVFILVPEMKNLACAWLVENATKSVQGVLTDSIRIDLDRRAVVVKYDSLITALKNIEFAIADAGFQANEIPANKAAQAALPAECR